MTDWVPFGMGVVSSIVAAVLIAIAAAIWSAGSRFTLSRVMTVLRLHRVMASIRMTTFVRARSDYAMFRRSHPTIDKYVSQARDSLTLVSISLATGEPFHGLTAVLREMTETRRPVVNVRISLLDPRLDYLMRAIAPVFRQTPSALAQEIRHRIKDLLDFRATLSQEAQSRIDIRVHRAIPFASAILIDPTTADGRLQIEAKPYKAPFEHSWGFEVLAGNDPGFYHTLVQSFTALVDDGETIREMK